MSVCFSQRREVDGKDLLRSIVSNLPVSEVLQLEGLPNRDSLSYASTYSLQESDGLKTLFRGTLRYVLQILPLLPYADLCIL